MARGPGSNRARAQSIYQAAMVANARRTAASDAAAAAGNMSSSLISVDITTENVALAAKLDEIDSRLDAIDPPE